MRPHNKRGRCPRRVQPSLPLFHLRSKNANLHTETPPPGNAFREVKSRKTGRTERYELITFSVGDPEKFKKWGEAYKWWCTMAVAATCFTVALDSAIIAANIAMIGFGVGPTALAPLSYFSKNSF
jgi:hypothetical protein